MLNNQLQTLNHQPQRTELLRTPETMTIWIGVGWVYLG
jgi:hypothetical protein